MTKTYYYNPPRLRTTLAITAGILTLGIGGGMLIVGCCEHYHSHHSHTPVSLEAQADKWFQSSESRVSVPDMARHASLATMYEVRLLRQEVQTLNSNITYLIDHLPDR
jgi:hypothetical protein